MPECKKCGAEIKWMQTVNSKWIPVDVDTIDDRGAIIFDQDQGMISHFATCPEADHFRKRKP